MCWSALAFALLGGAAFLLFYDAGEVSKGKGSSSSARDEHSSNSTAWARRHAVALNSPVFAPRKLDLDGTADDPRNLAPATERPPALELEAFEGDVPHVDRRMEPDHPSHSDAIRIAPVAPVAPGAAEDDKQEAPSEELFAPEAEPTDPIVAAAQRPEPALELRPPRDRAERQYEDTGIVIKPAAAPEEKRE